MFLKHNLWKRLFDLKIKNRSVFLLNPDHKPFLVRLLHIDALETPNPNSIRFSTDRIILKENIQPTTFLSLKSSESCSIAKQLHQLEGIESVFIGRDFISVNRQVGHEWEVLVDEIKEVMTSYFSDNDLVEILQDEKSISQEQASMEGDEDETVMAIKQLIEEKIRPTIQADGGDVIFKGFEGGVVKVKLQGSCVSCPSSEVTLKRGVQNMLQFYVPEVMGVIQVTDEKDDLSSKEFDEFEDSLHKS